MAKSDVACPKCGERDYWREDVVLNPSRKTVTIINHCHACATYFKKIKVLVRVDSKNKLIKKTQNV